MVDDKTVHKVPTQVIGPQERTPFLEVRMSMEEIRMRHVYQTMDWFYTACDQPWVVKISLPLAFSPFTPTLLQPPNPSTR